MAWKKGPLPKDTWDWGGVVVVNQQGSGFQFADFKGDHVILHPDGRRIDAHEVAMYDNDLKLPPKSI